MPIIFIGFLLIAMSCEKDKLITKEEETDQQDTICEPFTIFKTIDGEVYIQAENYSFSGGQGGTYGVWNFEDEKEGFLSKGYMRSSLDKPSDGSHLQFDTATANLNYLINFQDTGKYYVHFRTLAYDHTENGFFASIDGNEVNYGGINPVLPNLEAYFIYVHYASENYLWNWYTDGGGAEMRGLKVSFVIDTIGSHTFSVYRRDTGSRIDAIWLTKNVSNPQNSEELNLPGYNFFIEYQKL